MIFCLQHRCIKNLSLDDIPDENTQDRDDKPTETDKLTGERFIRDLVQLEQIAEVIEGNYQGELRFPSDWNPAIEETYRKIRTL